MEKPLKQPVCRLLFVCHGNICRSPMAEFIFRHLAAQAGVAERFVVASAATSSEEIGNGVYPPAKAVLDRLGIDCRNKTARRITAQDYANYDLIIGMDHENLRNLKRFFAPDAENKIHLLLDYAGRPGEEVDDPWYSGDFEQARADITAGCEGILLLGDAGGKEKTF